MPRSKYYVPSFSAKTKATTASRKGMHTFFYLLLCAVLLILLPFTLAAQSELDDLNIPIEIRDFEAILVTSETHQRNVVVTHSDEQKSHTETETQENSQDIPVTETIRPYYQVSCHVNYELSEHMREALRNGIRLFSEFRVKLIKHSNWWFNDADTLANKRYSLQYHGLSKKYILTELDHNDQHLKQWNFVGLASALRQMGEVESLNLPPLELDTSQGEYALFAEAEVKEETPELPLRVQSWFSSRKQQLTSEGIMWPLH